MELGCTVALSGFSYDTACLGGCPLGSPKDNVNTGLDEIPREHAGFQKPSPIKSRSITNSLQSPMLWQPGDVGFNSLHGSHSFPRAAPHPWLTGWVQAVTLPSFWPQYSGSDHSGSCGRDKNTQATEAACISAFISEVSRKAKNK